jgi:hypothetical protein
MLPTRTVLPMPKTRTIFNACAALAAVGLMALPAGAAAISQPARLGSGATRLLEPATDRLVPFVDRVLTGKAALRAAEVGDGGTTIVLNGPDGTPVTVELSPSIPDTPGNRALVQSKVNFLGALPHGSELRRVKLRLLTNAELTQACDDDPTDDLEVLACYDGSRERLFAPLDPERKANEVFTPEFVLAHEYGHHVARNRVNPPFFAGSFGPKYWATYNLVCNFVDRGIYFPGDQSAAHYFDNPGEGWAESYARMATGTTPRWDYNDNMEPASQEELDVIRLDVLRPWKRDVSKTFSGRLPRSGRTVYKSLRVTLDGDFKYRFRSSRGLDWDVASIRYGKLINVGSRAAPKLAVCSTGKDVLIKFKIFRKRGSGRAYSLKVTYPG